MNKPVNFEIAKLLKEKEFNLYCQCSYWNDELTPYTPGYALEDGTTSNEKYWEFERYYAPTITEVVMWLYEKHGIWIECLHRGMLGDFTFKVSKLKKGWRTEPHYIHETGFNSPTGAYEAAIKHTLENLI